MMTSHAAVKMIASAMMRRRPMVFTEPVVNEGDARADAVYSVDIDPDPDIVALEAAGDALAALVHQNGFNQCVATLPPYPHGHRAVGRYVAVCLVRQFNMQTGSDSLMASVAVRRAYAEPS